MESLHFINIIFAELPDEQSIGPGEFNFFYISPLKSLNLGIIPGCKIRWPPGHLGCNLFAKFQRTRGWLLLKSVHFCEEFKIENYF